MASLNGARSILDLIGSTPVVKLKSLPGKHDAEVWAKMESSNPGGSVKDRICLNMIETAEREGKLKPGATIVEPTSGNTGIGLALVAAVKGYRLILTMPDTMSEERRSLLAAYGAQLILTPDTKGMGGAIHRAEELLQEHPDYFMPQQFNNPANPDVHRKTTAVEIAQTVQTDRRVCRRRRHRRHDYRGRRSVERQDESREDMRRRTRGLAGHFRRRAGLS